jgi:RNA polymerase sigma-70 factor (ECF subfamily)
MPRDRDYASIWEEVGPTLWRALYAYTGGRREIADDAVAEAFALVMEHDGEVRDPKAYCYRVAFRLAAADLRHERRNGQVLDAEWAEPAGAAAEDRLDIMEGLRRLPPRHRSAVYLHYQADLPVREIARLLGTSGPAVRVRLMRGRRKLAELLGDDEP